MIYRKKTRPAPWTLTKSGAAQIAKREKDALQRKQRTPKQRKRVSPMSVRRRGEHAQYLKCSRAFLKRLRADGHTCPIVSAITELQELHAARRISNKITECHHKFGRAGALYLWEPGWSGLSKHGHRWVHQHVEESIKRGWIASGALWNKPRTIMMIADQCVSNEQTMERLLIYMGYGR